MDTIYADLDEIVFDAREKRYGSYQMRKKSNRYLGRAAMIAFLLFLFTTAMPKMITWAFPGQEEEREEQMIVSVNLSDLPPPPALDEEEEPPPPPPENLPPPKPPSIEFKVPVPKPDDEVLDDETIEEMEEIEESNPDFETNEGDPDAEPDWDNILEGDGEPEEIVVAQDPEPDPNEFVLLEKEPDPVNMDDLKKLIGYPPMAKEAEIEGKVILRVLVDKNGNYVKHKRIKDPHSLLTKAVEDQIRNLKFTPGIQGGKPIKVWVTIPFDFKLLK